MKQFLSVLSFCCLLSISFAQPKKNPVKPVTSKSTSNGYHLKVKITPLATRKVYLGTYYGKGKILVDSTILDANNSGAFKANKKLVEGIYFVVSPNYSILFEILVGKKQDFTVVADTAKKEDVLIYVVCHGN